MLILVAAAISSGAVCVRIVWQSEHCNLVVGRRWCSCLKLARESGSRASVGDFGRVFRAWRPAWASTTWIDEKSLCEKKIDASRAKVAQAITRPPTGPYKVLRCLTRVVLSLSRGCYWSSYFLT